MSKITLVYWNVIIINVFCKNVYIGAYQTTCFFADNEIDRWMERTWYSDHVYLLQRFLKCFRHLSRGNRILGSTCEHIQESPRQQRHGGQLCFHHKSHSMETALKLNTSRSERPQEALKETDRGWQTGRTDKRQSSGLSDTSCLSPEKLCF